MENVNTALFKTIAETKESITWILDRQAELRSELLGFYKNELREIHVSLHSLGTGGVDIIAKKALESVEKHFVDQWQRSYDLITPGHRSVNGGAKIFPVTRFENINSTGSSMPNVGNIVTKKSG